MSDDRLKYVSEPGVLDIRKLQADGLYPSNERIAQGPVAVFECGQEIPCNPCETACPKGRIEIGDDITCMPRVSDECSGCGLCLSSCPGLCIFILNGAYGEDMATVTMLYEFTPLPEPGEQVDGLDRIGEKVCDASVVSVKKTRKTDRCYAVTVGVPKEFIHDVRHFAKRGA